MVLTRRVLLASCCAIWAAGFAHASELTSAPFDAERLSYAEKRILQAALELSGDYLGLLDGDWGEASRTALESYTIRTTGIESPTFAQVVPLLAALIAERDANGWRMIHDPATEMSYAFPETFLSRSADPDVTEFTSADGGFNLIVDFSTREAALAIHQDIVGGAVAGTEAYASVRDDRLVSSARLPGDIVAYVRSDAAAEGFLTISIIAAAVHKPKLAFLSSSIQHGRAPDFDLPATGVLAQLLSDSPP